MTTDAQARPVLVVDDEPFARAAVRAVLEDLPAVGVIDEASSGRDAVAALRRRAYAAVFLDIRMSDLDGFDVVGSLGEGHSPPIVFVTALDDRAVAAFDAAAVDYVVKPFTDERLVRAARRALERGPPAPPPRAELAVGRFAVRDRTRTYFVDVDDVESIEAAGNYATLVTGRREHLVRATLSDLERRLSPCGFRRVHRSALVHMRHVAEIRSLASGDGVVVLASGRRIRLSRRYKNRLPDLLV